MGKLILKDGIWSSEKNHSISYPSGGNSACLQIEENSFWFVNRNKVIWNVFSKFVLSAGSFKFLDFGGGNGFVAKMLQSQNIDTTLLEPGDGAISAHRRGVQQIYQCTIAEMPKEMIFDGIGLFDVLEHFADPVGILNEVQSHLKSGGKIIMTVPAYQFLWSVDDVEAGHYKRYAKSDLIKTFEAADLKVNYCSYFFAVLIAPIFLFRTLSSRNKGRDQVQVTQKKIAKEHKPSPVTRLIIDAILSFEELLRKVLGVLPVGASIIVVATKK